VDEKIVLFDTGKAARKVMDAWAYILLTMVFVLTALSGYAKPEMSPEFALNIGLDYVLFIIYCYAARLCLDNMALQRGAETPEYLDAITRMDKVRGAVEEADPINLQNFCERYREQELQATRSQILSNAALNEADYQSYLKSGVPKEAPRRVIKALKRAKRLKPIRINRYMLGRAITSKPTREQIVTPQENMAKSTAPQLLTTAFFVIFTGTLGFELISDPTFATFVAGMVKTFSVALSGVNGYLTRYRNIVQYTPEYAKKQEGLMYQYAAWLSKQLK